jgi:hypothetical protein
MMGVRRPPQTGLAAIDMVSQSAFAFCHTAEATSQVALPDDMVVKPERQSLCKEVEIGEC